MAFLPASNVFFIKETMVIGPTPPGTGVMNEHLGATSSNFTSPVSLKPDFLVASGTRVVPTSMTTAPSFTISAFTKLGCPRAAMMMSASWHSFILGYGAVQGVPHKSKPAEAVAKDFGKAPEWFRRGVNAALLAPTAMNQQKFSFAMKDGRVLAKADAGFYTKIELGIVKYHFEAAAGKENFRW